jgi:chemotaxis protein MotC
MSDMHRARRWLYLTTTILALATAKDGREAVASESLMPYTMVRSLQFVQDAVARGDHSAAEMQRFLLSTIDSRLKSAPTSIFMDSRNVDAALVYAMSGGNPATLEHLVARDVDGNFDTRVADVLRKYLDGRGTQIAKSIVKMVEEYRGQSIGAYIALITGNVTIPTDPIKALDFYDIARFEAPGTLIEEAALRRSLAISVHEGDPTRAFGYAKKYARRYMFSPYASQFADLIVSLTVQRFGEVGIEVVEETLGLLDQARQQEVYLRLARMSAVAGKDELARLASARASELSEGLPPQPQAQASLYDGLSKISTPDVVSAINTITDVPVDQLTERDRALRAAAKVIAEEVIRPPTQTKISTYTDMPGMGGSGIERGNAAQESARSVWRNVVPDLPPETEEYRTLVDTGQNLLDAIDKLLKVEGATR